MVNVSLNEQWSPVINEAAAAGLPVVVSRTCGAAAEIVEDGANGYLVDPSDTATISGALVRIIVLTSETLAAMGDCSCQIIAAGGPDLFTDGLLWDSQHQVARFLSGTKSFYASCRGVLFLQSRKCNLCEFPK